VFLLRFEIFYSYNIIDKDGTEVEYRTNRITGDINYFNTDLMTWFSNEDIINEQINSLHKQIENELEIKEKAIAWKEEHENNRDDNKTISLFRILDIEKLELNQDGLDGYEVEIEKLQQEIYVLELQLK
jgi:hypothetical protein